MKKITAGLLLLALNSILIAQSKSVVDQAVESGKVLVDLIKVFRNEKNAPTDTDCMVRFADLCITNSRDSSLTVAITHRASTEMRELIILPGGRECSLQLTLGVWTYALRIGRLATTIRKGDILIERCQDLEMTVQ